MSKEQPGRNTQNHEIAGRGDPLSAEDGQWTEPQIRFMKRAIAVMSTILVLGFMLLIWRIMNLTGDKTSPSAPAGAASTSKPGIANGVATLPLAQPLSFKALAQLSLPPNAQIRQISLSGQLLAVHYSAPEGRAIAIIDLASGETISTVRVSNKVK